VRAFFVANRSTQVIASIVLEDNAQLEEINGEIESGV